MLELSVPRRQLPWQELPHSLCRSLQEQSAQHCLVWPGRRLSPFTFAQTLELELSFRALLKV